MTTVIIDENTEGGREILEIIRAMKQSGNPAIIGIWENEPGSSVHEPSAPYQTLSEERVEEEEDIFITEALLCPMTIGEFNAEIDRSLEDARQGRVISQEDLKKEMEGW